METESSNRRHCRRSAVPIIVLASLTLAFPSLALPQTSAQTTSPIVWGIEVGDTIKWNVGKDVYTPYSHKTSNDNYVWEILEICDDETVCVRETYWDEPVLTDTGYVRFPITNDVYEALGTEIPFLMEEMTNQNNAGVFPLFVNGDALLQMVAVDLELDLEWTDSGDYLTGYGIEGETIYDPVYVDPPETYWLNIHVHKGTGIVTWSEWYYDSDEYGITTRATLSIIESNIDWDDRLPYAPLAASVSSTPSSGDPPLVVSFTASVSGGRTPYTYDWDFGDGGTSSLTNPSHTYDAPGYYQAVMTVADCYGISLSKTLYISVGESHDSQDDDYPPPDYETPSTSEGITPDWGALIIVATAVVILSVILLMSMAWRRMRLK